jgi:parallel beta-helix repeat protein
MSRFISLIMIAAISMFFACDQQKNPSDVSKVDESAQARVLIPSEISGVDLTDGDAVKQAMTEFRAKKMSAYSGSFLRPRKIDGARIAATLTVPSASYPTLQDAINAAFPGDKIKLVGGSTPGGVIPIGLTGLRVTSEAPTAVTSAIYSYADFVEIDHVWFSGNGSGVWVYGDDTRVHANTFTGGADVVLWDCWRANVKRNSFTGFGAYLQAGFSGGNHNLDENEMDGGIDSNCWGTTGVTYSDNVIENSLWGVYMLDADNGEVSDGTYTGNANYGIWVGGSSSFNKIGSNNDVIENFGDGIYLGAGTSSNEVTKNTATCNDGDDIKDDGTGNTFKKNTTGCL